MRQVLRIEAARWGAQCWGSCLLDKLLIVVFTPLVFHTALAVALPSGERLLELEVLAAVVALHAARLALRMAEQ
eukprot:11735636-Karenia_brevis.AAC.1